MKGGFSPNHEDMGGLGRGRGCKEGSLHPILFRKTETYSDKNGNLLKLEYSEVLIRIGCREKGIERKNQLNTNREHSPENVGYNTGGGYRKQCVYST